MMGNNTIYEDVELIPTKEKAHGGIVSNFFIDTDIVYCLTGFEHISIMEKLGVNYLVFYDNQSFTNISKAKNETIVKGVKDKYLIFLTSNDEDYLSFIKSFKEIEKTYKKIYCFDLEVLKAVSLIPNEELSQNDYQIGLTVCGNSTFKALIDEVKSDLGFDDKRLYSHIKDVLEIEEKRVIL
jgi:hypothetical protein